MSSSNSNLREEFLPDRYFRPDQIAGYHQISRLLYFPSTVLFIHTLHVLTSFFLSIPRAFIGDCFLLLIHKLKLFRHLVFHKLKYTLLLFPINDINGKNMISEAKLKLCYKNFDTNPCNSRPFIFDLSHYFVIYIISFCKRFVISFTVVPEAYNYFVFLSHSLSPLTDIQSTKLCNLINLVNLEKLMYTLFFLLF